MTSKQLQLFQTGISITFLCAFLSIYVQLRGLYGESGILPVNSAPEHTFSLISLLAPKYTSYIHGLEILAILGTIISFLQISFTSFTFTGCLVQVLAYQSIYKCGQVFMHFQWDILLLESGWLVVLSCLLDKRLSKRLKSGKTDENGQNELTNPAMELVRFLGFKLMFVSGVVKLLSQCSTWWGLTALHHHFQTQCIVTPLSWLAHNLTTDYTKRLFVAGTFFMQLQVSFFFFSPKKSQKLAAFMHIFMQITIALTGNYNFFNLNAIFLMVPILFSDSEMFLWRVLRKNKISAVFVFLVEYFGIFAVAIFDYFYLLKNDVNGDVVLNFEVEDLKVWLDGFYFPLAFGLFLMSFLEAMVFYKMTDTNAVSDKKAVSAPKSQKMRQLADTIFNLTKYTLGISLAYFIFLSTSEKLAQNNRKLQAPISKFTRTQLPYLKDIHWQALYFTSNYDVSFTYGLFRQMTGVKHGRPEIVVKATKMWPDPLPSAFEELNFNFKPTSMNSGAVWVAPHQPRLDWQMWFAALTNSAQQTTWFYSFLFRICGGSKDVWHLISQENKSLFNHANPPRAIKATKLFYRFTGNFSVSDRQREVFKVDNDDIWWRQRSGDAYDDNWLSPINGDSPHLVKWMKEAGYIYGKKVKTDKRVVKVLDFFINLLREFDITMVILGSVWLSLMMRCVVRLMSGLNKIEKMECSVGKVGDGKVEGKIVKNTEKVKNDTKNSSDSKNSKNSNKDSKKKQE